MGSVRGTIPIGVFHFLGSLAGLRIEGGADSTGEDPEALAVDTLDGGYLDETSTTNEDASLELLKPPQTNFLEGKDVAIFLRLGAAKPVVAKSGRTVN